MTSPFFLMLIGNCWFLYVILSCPRLCQFWFISFNSLCMHSKIIKHKYMRREVTRNFWIVDHTHSGRNRILTFSLSLSKLFSSNLKIKCHNLSNVSFLKALWVRKIAKSDQSFLETAEAVGYEFIKK